MAYAHARTNITTGPKFIRSMCRNIVGTLVDVGNRATRTRTPSNGGVLVCCFASHFVHAYLGTLEGPPPASRAFYLFRDCGVMFELLRCHLPGRGKYCKEDVERMFLVRRSEPFGQTSQTKSHQHHQLDTSPERCSTPTPLGALSLPSLPQRRQTRTNDEEETDYHRTVYAAHFSCSETPQCSSIPL